MYLGDYPFIQNNVILKIRTLSWEYEKLFK